MPKMTTSVRAFDLKIQKVVGQYGVVQLNLGDCYRHVSFDFNMDTKGNRSDSLYKIRRIAEIVNSVRDALEIEVESIESSSTPILFSG
jgi:hypothetical protein